MRKHICTREKAITIILSFAMIVGLLGGMKLDVRAKERTIDLASYIKDHLGETIDLGTISGDSSIKAEVTYDMGLCYMDGVLVDKRKDDYSTGAGAGSSIQTALNGIRNPGIMSLDLTQIDGIDPQLTYSMQIYGWKDGESYDNAYHIFLYLSIITIDTLNITVTQPEAGQPLPTVENRGVNVTEGAEVTAVKWDVNIGGSLAEVENGVKAEYNTQYVLNVWVKAKDGYKFGDRVVYDATINGERTGVSSGEEKGTLWFSKYFPKTELDPYEIRRVDITVPQPVAGERLPDVTQVTQSITGAKVNSLEWHEGESLAGPDVTGGTAKGNTIYTVRIRYDAEEGYSFGTYPSATVNSQYANWEIWDQEHKIFCVIYRFQAKGSDQANTINSVNITIDLPVGGQLFPTTCTISPSGVKVTKVKWLEGATEVTGTAGYNTVYQAKIYFEPESNYEFGSGVQVTVNGESKSWYNDGGYHVGALFQTGAKPSDEGVKITDGNDSTYEPGSNESLTFRGSGEVAYFKDVKVDGTIVDRTNYDVREGSTIITFTPEYLKTLRNGSHTVEMFWNINGAVKSAAASFHIGEKSGEVVPGNTGTTQPADNTESEPRHVCSFEWVITLDPTTGADGLEEYKCTGCGVVQESHPIPASVAVVKDFYGKVKEAPEKGSITYDSGKLYTISDYILKKMAERNDVAVTVKFEYQNKKYQLIFPAGLDYSAVLNDEESMYGYFGAAARLGLKVTGQ